MYQNMHNVKKSPARNRRRSNGRRASLTARRPIAAVLQTPSKNAASNIKVLLRVRPATRRELEDCKYRDVVEIVDGNFVIFDPKEEEDPFFHQGKKQAYRDINKRQRKHLQFNFDRVFGPEDCTQEVYDSSIKDLIPNLLQGYNCTVFAYGATGAGKTHTMLGSTNTPGVTPLLMSELYTTLESLEYSDVQILVSYLEIYNEMVHDLLVDQTKVKPLLLHEDGNSVAVSDLTWVRPSTANDLMDLLHLGNERRTQHPTDANAESSRSHAVFQVVLKMKHRPADGSKGQVRCAKLSMIDLAGSERAASTTNNRPRFKEGANINKSLLSLGNCINALADGQKHVPFRNSKLTRLLKGSLGGNCQTVMIANTSPALNVYEDTYNTLKYATRAKKIKNKVKKNLVSVDLNAAEFARAMEDAQTVISNLRAENAALIAENTRLKAASKPAEQEVTIQNTVDTCATSDVASTDLLQRLALLEAENEALRSAQAEQTQELNATKLRLIELEAELVSVKTAPPQESPQKAPDHTSEVSYKEDVVTRLSEKLRDLAIAGKNLDRVLEVKHQLKFQLESLEYNYAKKISKIEKINEFKKDSTQTKLTSLDIKTNASRGSVVSRIQETTADENRERTNVNEALADLHQVTKEVLGDLATQIMPFFSAKFDLTEAQLQIKYCKITQAQQAADLSAMHNLFMSTASLLYSAFYLLKGLNSTSPDMEKKYEDLICMVRNPCNVTFEQENIKKETLTEEEMKEEEADEVLAVPLNATFCVAPASTSRLPSLNIPTRAPVEKTNILPTPTPPVKKPRVSPKLSFRPSTSTTPRYSVGKGLTSAGRRKRTPLRNNFKKFKRPPVPKMISYNKENSRLD